MNPIRASLLLSLFSVAFVGCGQEELPEPDLQEEPALEPDPIIGRYEVTELDGTPLPSLIESESQGSGIFCDHSLVAALAVNDRLSLSFLQVDEFSNCTDERDRTETSSTFGTIEVVVPGSQYIFVSDEDTADCTLEGEQLVCRVEDTVSFVAQLVK